MAIYNNITEVWQLEHDERFIKENPYYFSPDTLKFFGERKSEMKIYKKHEMVTDYRGVVHECYVLKKVQHKAPVGVSKVKYDYFDIHTLDRILT